MTQKTVFLNDQYVPYDQALVHIEDRGFQLGDGIYEVVLFENGKFIDFYQHIDRLFRSAWAISLKIDKRPEEFHEIALKLFKENNLNSGWFYLQVTRGTCPRRPDFPFECKITINALANPLKTFDPTSYENGIKAITHDDIRWSRCDIKSICLLAQNMIRSRATADGADEAILIRDGFVTEGSYSNIFIVNKKDQLVTRMADNFILKGITRDRILILARENGIEVIEGEIKKEDLFKAKEVFATSSTLKIRPISEIDGQKIGNGKIGEISKNLLHIYNNFVNS